MNNKIPRSATVNTHSRIKFQSLKNTITTTSDESRKLAMELEKRNWTITSPG